MEFYNNNPRSLVKFYVMVQLSGKEEEKKEGVFIEEFRYSHFQPIFTPEFTSSIHILSPDTKCLVKNGDTWIEDIDQPFNQHSDAHNGRFVLVLLTPQRRDQPSIEVRAFPQNKCDLHQLGPRVQTLKLHASINKESKLNRAVGGGQPYLQDVLGSLLKNTQGEIHYQNHNKFLAVQDAVGVSATIMDPQQQDFEATKKLRQALNLPNVKDPSNFTFFHDNTALEETEMEFTVFCNGPRPQLTQMAYALNAVFEPSHLRRLNYNTFKLRLARMEQQQLFDMLQAKESTMQLTKQSTNPVLK